MSLAYNAHWYHFAHSRIFFKIWVNLKTASTLSAKFIQYSKPSVVILRIFTAPSLGVASISRKHFAHPYEATPHPFNFSQDFKNSVTSSSSNPTSLAVSTTATVTSSTEAWNPSKSSMRVGINFLQTLVNVDILASSHELRMFLLALRWWILSRLFLISFAQIHQKNHYLWQPHEMYFLSERLESWNQSLIHRLQNRCCVSRHENIMNLLHFHQSSCVTRCIINEK